MSRLPEQLRGVNEVIDLTYTLSPEFPLYPVYDPPTVADKFTCDRDGYFVRSWTFDEHSGTHVDAPAHFGGPSAATIDRIAPEDLVLAVAVIDVRDRVARDEDALVTPDDVLAWERRHGRLADRSALFALTGWGKRVRDPAAFLNADSSGAMHTPGFASELADFLKEERPGVRALGIDTANLDAGHATDFPTHVSWLPGGCYGIENLARLDRVPEAGATVIVGAPALAGGSGGPARILALA